jgi:hypothetical protein
MCFSNSTRFRSPILVLGIVAVSLFFLGPQMGSLDTDGDGYPDTPIAVSPITVAPPSSSAWKNPTSPIRAASLLPDVAFPSHDSERAEPVSQAGRAALKSFCLLRC